MRAVYIICLFLSTFERLHAYGLGCDPRDRIADLIRSQLGMTASQLTLAQVLESATWKGGREIAKLKRPETGGPPIEIESDGTVF